jgi:glycosyltransferase involved in cell wall biosynthesis
MRAGLIIYGSLDTLSGGYLYDRMLVRSLMADGWEVDVFALPWRDYAQHLGDNVSRAWRARLRTAAVDVMIQDELNHPSLVWLNRSLAGRVPYRTVSLVHHLRCSEEHPAALRRVYRAVERHYLNSVDAVIANSQTTLASVNALLARPKPALVAYPAGDHLPAPQPGTHGSSGPLRVLFVGNLIPRKGLHTLLDGLARVAPASWQLTVIGRQDVDPGYTKVIQAQIAAPGTGAPVRLLGRVTDDALAAAYASHDLLAVPSYEGFGIVYLEAMRCGLPVLASTAGAAREIVTDGVDGFLTPPGDAAAIAAIIARLANDRDTLAQMRAAAFARYARQPTWAQSMTTVSTWLAEMVNKQ